jgi:outer membrane protein TolC
MTRLLGICLALMTANLAAFGQTNAPGKVRELSLQDCIELTLRHNIDLKIDRYNPEIQLYALRGAYGAYDPNLSLSGQHDHRESGTVFANNQIIVGSKTDDNAFNSSVNGKLPWGTTYTLSGRVADTYGSQAGFPFENTAGSASITGTQPLLKNFLFDESVLTIRIAKNRLKYTEQTLKQQIMAKITALEQAYYDLIYNRENVLVQEKAVELAERLVAENRKKLEVGTLAPLDLQSAEAQAASSRAAVIAASSQLGTQERVVKQIISEEYSGWAFVELVPTGTLTAQPPIVNLQDSWSKGLSQRPDLVQAKLDIEQTGIQLKYDRNQLLPELDIFGTYGYNGTGKEYSDFFYDVQQQNRPFYTYGGSITIPLTRTTTRNTYKSDKAKLQQNVLTLKNLEQTIMIAIDNDIGTIRANFDQVHATRTAREYQESALDAEQKKLESGKSTTYTVLQVQRDLTSARGAEIQALDTYNKSLSQLSLDEGSTLDRLGIRFEVK